MPTTNKFWYQLVMAIAALGYICIAIGGYFHRSELNIASYSVWLVLSAMMAYSSKKQNLSSFHMVMSWVIGNAALIVFSLAIGDYTYNLDAGGTIAFYGVISTFAVWGAAASITKKFNSWILFYGVIMTDCASFYPQLKQYYYPHEQATPWMYAGWILWVVAAAIQLVHVDKFIANWRAKTASRLKLLETSATSLENGIMLIITTIMMAVWSR
jgi:hypothetical protein